MDDVAVQFDIFGNVHVPRDEPRAPATHVQARLFEPQFEGQFAMEDNPEERTTDGDISLSD